MAERKGYHDAIEQIVQAWERKVWIAEGLGSWDELVEAKNWHWRPNTQGERSAVAEIFRQKGFSLRAIGTVLASGQQTIARDLAGEEVAGQPHLVGVADELPRA